MTLRKYLAATALGTSMLMGATVAGSGALFAQTAGAEAGAPVSEDELSAFARATLAMSEVRDAYIQRIEAAADEAEQQELIEEGNAAMLTAVEDEPGMTMERYFEISEAAQADPDLNERIMMQIDAMVSDG